MRLNDRSTPEMESGPQRWTQLWTAALESLCKSTLRGPVHWPRTSVEGAGLKVER